MDSTTSFHLGDYGFPFQLVDFTMLQHLLQFEHLIYLFIIFFFFFFGGGEGIFFFLTLK